jgi:predicted RNase H-like HicB family nuclease
LIESYSCSALCPELDVATQGASVQEARALLLEAAILHLEGAFEDGLPYLRPIPREEDPRLTTPERVEEEFRFKVDVTRGFRALPLDPR